MGAPRSGVRGDADTALLTIGNAVDVLRIGAWYAFLLLLNEGPRSDGRRGTARMTWLLPVAAALVALGLLAQVSVGLALTAFGDPGRLALFDGLALTVFGLVLVEQLFRNCPKNRAGA